MILYLFEWRSCSDEDYIDKHYIVRGDRTDEETIKEVRKHIDDWKKFQKEYSEIEDIVDHVNREDFELPKPHGNGVILSTIVNCGCYMMLFSIEVKE